MRLIDADALIMAIPDTSADIFENCRYCKLLDKEQITEIINNAPTIEAERHGHWKEHPLDWEQRVCSVCGGTAETITYHLKDGRVRSRGTPYCPHCGALMEEEVEEDE